MRGDREEPVQGARVGVATVDTGVLTDSAGRFDLAVPAGTEPLELRVRLLGYCQWERTFEAEPGRLDVGEVRLLPVPIGTGPPKIVSCGEKLRRPPRDTAGGEVTTGRDSAGRWWLVCRELDPEPHPVRRCRDVQGEADTSRAPSDHP